MSIFDLPSPTQVAAHFCQSLSACKADPTPYMHWCLKDTLPESVVANIMMLPIRPPIIDECGGVRDLNDNNKKRSFFTPQLQKDFPVCQTLAEAMQCPEVAKLCAKTFGIKAPSIFLRMEYIQDTDGAWLEPHHDVPAKLCSMVLYMCTGPEAKGWGTDIYDNNKKWFGRATPAFNSCVVFIPGENTWHGYEKRPILGVRRLMEINYVHPSWRDKDQLCFPDKPIKVA